MKEVLQGRLHRREVCAGIVAGTLDQPAAVTESASFYHYKYSLETLDANERRRDGQSCPAVNVIELYRITRQDIPGSFSRESGPLQVSSSHKK